MPLVFDDEAVSSGGRLVFDDMVPTKKPGTTTWDDTKDAAKAASMGVLGLGQMATNLAYAATGAKFLKSTADTLGGTNEMIQAGMTPQMQEAQKKKFITQEEPTSPDQANVADWIKSYGLGDAWKDPRALGFQVANQGGSMVAGMGLGRVLGVGVEAATGVAKLKPALDAAGIVGQVAEKAALASGVDAQAASVAGKSAAQATFAEEAAKVGVKDASLDATVKGIYRANMGAQLAEGTYMHGSDAANHAMESIAAMPNSELDKSPKYVEAYQQHLANGESEQEARDGAREDIRRVAGLEAAATTATVALPAQLVMAHVNAKLFTGGMGAQSRLGNVAKAVGLEAPANAFELGAVAAGSNVGVRDQAKPDLPIYEDVGNTAVSAFIGGAGMGMAHVATPVHGTPKAAAPAQADPLDATAASPAGAAPAEAGPDGASPVTPSGSAGPSARANTVGAIPGATAPIGATGSKVVPEVRLAELELLSEHRSLTEGEKAEAEGLIRAAHSEEVGAGAQPQFEDVPDLDPVHPAETVAAPAPASPAGAAPADATVAPNTAAVAPDVSAAEKALHTPVELTSLDRVNEIDKQELALREQQASLVGQSADSDSAASQEAQAVHDQRQHLANERAMLTRDWPKAVEGAPSSFTTEAGARVNATYSLMDAGDLVTSHNTDLRQNPDYPQELQPRDRDRAASEMQVSGIVQKLDPARLGLSADAANGAPIVGADGLVESGNARTIALKRVYQANGQKAADYKQWLQDNAAQFGLTPDAVSGMAKPVLVRVRTTPVNRAEFARQANASTVAMMSPSEMAKSDANRIDSMEDLTPDDSGDFSNAASRPFVRRFMARLPTTEQAGMIDANGALSTAGYARVRNAVLAKAYGDSPVLARLTESMDNNLLNVSRALILAAPKVAQMRDAMGTGHRFDADMTPDLMGAVEELSRLKDSGTSVDQALAQAGLLGDDMPQEVRDLLRFLADNARRPRKIADFIVSYMEALDAAGDPSQGSLLGDVHAPSKSDLLTAAKRSQNADGKSNGQSQAAQDTKRAEPAKDAQHGAEAQTQQAHAPGNQGGAGRNGLAAEPGTGQRSEQRAGSRPSDSAGGAKQSAAGDKAGSVSNLPVAPGWEAFKPDTGTLGIPRAEMPQIKGKDRGALVQFLKARGIAHETVEVKPDTLHPTQAEFSPDKVADLASADANNDRSVLISSDDYILDGHHQWMAAVANGEPVKAIRFDAPIKEPLTQAAEFPSATTSEQSSTAEQQQPASAKVSPEEDFKHALSDMVKVASQHTTTAMAKEDMPGLMPALVDLFNAAMRLVGTDLKVATAHVKAAMKANANLKPFWNKIGAALYGKAAEQALAGLSQSSQKQPATAPSAIQPTDVPTKAKIEDAGQKIGGARKDRWKERGLDLSDLANMTEAEGAELATKANVWKPDYAGMIERGTRPEIAAFIKVVYDTLAAKPKKNTPEGRRLYVTAMQQVRQVYTELAALDELGGKQVARTAMADSAEVLKVRLGVRSKDPGEVKEGKALLFSVYKGRSDPFVVSVNEEMRARKLVADGFPTGSEPWKKRFSVAAYGGPGFTAHGLETTIKEAESAGTPITAEQLKAGVYRVVSKAGQAMAYLPTRADAEAAAKTIYDGKLKAGASDKAEPARPHLDTLKRENLPQRVDRDVSADDFVKDFGFRGVEFGNWAAQDERQRIINMAYDGLRDLADIMGVPPKALSLNGTLGMAFGARGGGKFAAHYEPGKLVINMTKLQGGGSMAHEWAHALDHYLGELDRPDAYTTAARGASGWYTEDQYKGVPVKRMEQVGKEWKTVEKLRLDNLRPELAQAFDRVMSALFSGKETKAQMIRGLELQQERTQALATKETDPQTKAMYSRMVESQQMNLDEARQEPDDKTYPKGRSSFAANAQKLSGKSANGYWSRPTEMFARAFESWVFDKVAAMGAKSDYLVHGVEADRFAGGQYKGNPYPVGSERATINMAFDQLARTIKTKETDQGNIALFQKDGEGYSDGNDESTISDDGPESARNIGMLERGVARAPGGAGADSVHPYVGRVLPGHEQISRVAAAFGDTVQGFGLRADLSAEQLRQFGFFNGAYLKGTIYLRDIGQDRPHLAILGHEMAHRMAATQKDLYGKLVKAIQPYIDRERYDSEFRKSSVAKNLTSEAGVHEEFVGEVLSDGFMEKKFWRAIGNSNPSLLQKVMDFIGDLIDTIKASVGYRRRTDRILTDFDRVMEIAGEVMGEYGAKRGANAMVPAANAAFNRADDVGSLPFKKWFGNSTVVDEKGEPLVMYHGTNKSDNGDAFSFFDAYGSNYGLFGQGSYFTDDSSVASEYTTKGKGDAPSVYPVYLSIKNPIDMDKAVTRELPAWKKAFPEVDFEGTDIQPRNGDHYTNEDFYRIAEESFIDQEYPKWEASQALQEGLMSMGYDGITHIGGGRVKSEGKKHRVFIAFEPEQVKSATGNSGAYDPANSDIRFNRNTLGSQPTPAVAPAQANTWTVLKSRIMRLTSPESIDKLIYEFQDKYIDLKRIRDHIAELGGTITDLNDAYLGEELFHKRLGKRTEDFLAHELQPLMEGLKAHGLTMEQFEQFLHARHAPEANAAMAERNPNRAYLDGVKAKANAEVNALEMQLQRAVAQGTSTKAIEASLLGARADAAKWNGAQAFQGNEDDRLALSGMSDADAAAHMASLSPKVRQQLDALAAKVDAINSKTLDILENYGLMDRATLAAWRKEYQFYVPLHRDDAQADSASHPTGSGFSVRGNAAKSRTGSNEKVTHILGHVAMQREAALTRGEKNNVAKQLYLMAAQNPDDELWTLDKPPMTKSIDSNGIVRKGIDPLYKTRPNVLMVRIGGKDVAIVFNEHNAQGMRLVTAMKNLDVGDLHVVLGLASKGTRWFASVNTQYNPVFGLINFARDLQEGMVNLSTTPLQGKQLDVAKNVFTAMRAIYRQERDKGAASPESQKWMDLWEEMQEVGGTTGYRDLYADAADRVKALEGELHALDRGQVSKAAHAVVDWLSVYNESMENSVRLSAYKVALDNGLTKERAASLAKNLTVNFNRKGRQSREIGALYAFFNAAMQGTARMAETLKGPLGKRIMLGGIAMGAVMSLVGMAVMGGGGGGDDDKKEDNEWDKIPDFVKERSLIIPLSRTQYVSIPLPLGFKLFPNIGRIAMETAFDGPKHTAGKAIGDLLSSLVDTFNPLGGAQNMGQMAAPTVLDPVVALATNTDWTGKPIYRENNNPLNPQPGTKMVRDSASTPGRMLAEVINRVTGGSQYRPGAWSPTPDQLDYAFGQLTGGLGRELIKANQAIASQFTGDELPAYKIPLVGRLYGSTSGPAAQSEQFYANVKALNEVENELKGRNKNRESIDDYRRSEPLTALAGRGNAYEMQVSHIRNQRRDVVQRAEPGYQDRVKTLDNEIGNVMARLNREVAKAQLIAAAK